MAIINDSNEPNFITAGDCEASNITANLLQEIISKAAKGGRKYVYSPLGIDYLLPEKQTIDYENLCPMIVVERNNNLGENVIRADAFGLIEDRLGNSFHIPLVFVLQVEGDLNIEELTYISRLYAYARFFLRDLARESDLKFWHHFCKENIVSNNTVPIFREDKEASGEWAANAFPDNLHNAWVGKCGEFVFGSWASERRLSVSNVAG